MEDYVHRDAVMKMMFASSTEPRPKSESLIAPRLSAVSDSGATNSSPYLWIVRELMRLLSNEPFINSRNK